jgi:hypothetical protein
MVVAKWVQIASLCKKVVAFWVKVAKLWGRAMLWGMVEGKRVRIARSWKGKLLFHQVLVAKRGEANMRG